MPEIVKLEHTPEEKKAVEYYDRFFDIVSRLEDGWRVMGNEGSGTWKLLEALQLMIGYHFMAEEERCK